MGIFSDFFDNLFGDDDDIIDMDDIMDMLQCKQVKKKIDPPKTKPKPGSKVRITQGSKMKTMIVNKRGSKFIPIFNHIW